MPALGHMRAVRSAALRPARVARPAAVAQHVQVELQLLAARGELEHRSCISSNGARREQPKPRPHPRDVGVDRHVAHPEGEQQHARGGLPPDAGQRGQVLLRLRDGHPRQPVERQLASRARSSVIARRIDLIRADLTFEIPPGRIASSISSTGASRTSVPCRASARAAPDRRRRGCGRWSTARGRSGSARRSGDRGARCTGSRRRAGAGRGSRAPGAGRGPSPERRRPAYSSAPQRSHAWAASSTASCSAAGTAGG